MGKVRIKRRDPSIELSKGKPSVFGRLHDVCLNGQGKQCIAQGGFATDYVGANVVNFLGQGRERAGGLCQRIGQGHEY